MTSSESPPNGKATGTHSVQVYQAQAAQIRASPGNLCSTKQPLESGPMRRRTAWAQPGFPRLESGSERYYAELFGAGA